MAYLVLDIVNEIKSIENFIKCIFEYKFINFKLYIYSPEKLNVIDSIRIIPEPEQNFNRFIDIEIITILYYCYHNNLMGEEEIFDILTSKKFINPNYHAFMLDLVLKLINDE